MEPCRVTGSGDLGVQQGPDGGVDAEKEMAFGIARGELGPEPSRLLGHFSQGRGKHQSPFTLHGESPRSNKTIN
jgi:hypothetical protein